MNGLLKNTVTVFFLGLMLFCGITRADYAPFGAFEAPVEGSTVSGVVAVTGWALDDVGIQLIEVFREPLDGEGDEWIFLGEAVSMEGARPDVAAVFPDYPGNTAAGWQYMLLTNGLPEGGNGTFVLRVVVTDTDHNKTMLGPRTFHCDNANAVKPFGNLDSPGAGEVISGEMFPVSGWALTPQPNAIPTDGSTMTLYLDGVEIGMPIYNQYREYIATLLPGYNNSDGAGFEFTIDTRQYADGIHTIQAIVMDNAGNTEGIGSRYFKIDNTGDTGVEPHASGAVAAFQLMNPYPNPFNCETVIPYRLVREAEVCVEIFDIHGRRVMQWRLGTEAAGEHHLTWNSLEAPSGVYICRLQADDFVTVKRMILQK